MATQQELQNLDEANRQAQAANASAIAVLVLTYYAQIDPGKLSISGSTWLDQSVSAIVAGWRRSAALQAAYFRAVRQLQVPDAPAFTLPPVPEPNVLQIRKSLTYTGLVTAAQGLAKTPQRVDPEPPTAATVHTDGVGTSDLARMAQDAIARAAETNQRLDARREQIMVKSAAMAAGAAVRHVQNGGREQTINAVQKDLVATGYVRITRPGCCAFCAMLASRGPVYRKDSFEHRNADPRFTGFGEVKVHDVCQCSLRPVYNHSMSEWPDLSLTYSDLWTSTTADVRGKEKMREFRRQYEKTAAFQDAQAAKDALTQ